MSSNSQHEDHGLRHKQSGYTTLGKTWVYSCPKTNVNYSSFGAGVNCLCAKDFKRSTMDQYLISGTKPPVSNQRLGWKL
jgi:hypothetical protein